MISVTLQDLPQTAQVTVLNANWVMLIQVYLKERKIIEIILSLQSIIINQEWANEIKS
jgi:hypothetical protein